MLNRSESTVAIDDKVLKLAQHLQNESYDNIMDQLTRNN